MRSKKEKLPRRLLNVCTISPLRDAVCRVGEVLDGVIWEAPISDTFMSEIPLLELASEEPGQRSLRSLTGRDFWRTGHGSVGLRASFARQKRW